MNTTGKDPPRKPQAFQGDLRNLPEALKPLTGMRGWVCWKWEWKVNKNGVGKWDKPPIQPRNPRRYAKNNDPGTWGTYAEALAAFEAGLCDGIGLNLSGTALAAFDIDNCRDRSSGEIAVEAMSIVNRANSYTEMTVSGNGLRVIGFGRGSKVHRKQSLPGSAVKVESYCGAERYIVITGNPLPGTLLHIADISSVMGSIVAELDGKQDSDPVLKFSEEPRWDDEFRPDVALLPGGLVALINDGVLPHQDLSAAFHHAICWLHVCGWGAPHIEDYITGKPIVPQRYNSRLTGEIERCLRKAKAEQQSERQSSEPGVQQSRERASNNQHEWSDPVDLWAKFEPPTLVRGLLPDIIERFAFDRGRAMGADMSGIAVSALAACAAAITDEIQLQVKKHDKEWRESARIWVANVGSVSAKKTPIMSAAVKPLRRIDARMAKANAEESARYNRLAKEEKTKTEPPKQTRLMIQDTTIEAGQEILKDSPNGVLAYHDELTGWFGSMDKYSGRGRGSDKDRAFYLDAYNGMPYSVHRIGRGSIHIPNLSISMLGGIQPDPMRKVSEDSLDDGLLQRFLVIVLQPATVGFDEAPSGVVDEYDTMISRLHGLRPQTAGSTQIVNLRFDDGALAIREELEKEHIELQNWDAINRKLAAHIGKYDGIFARLCVIWHCVEQ
jgi:hypothetical protein